MRKFIAVTAVLLALLPTVGMAQAFITSTATDYLNVPTADTLDSGTVQIDLWALSSDARDPLGARYQEAYNVSFGVLDNLEVFGSGLLSDEWNESDHMQFGAKFQFSPGGEENDYLKGALFLYGVRNDMNPVPGIALTYDDGSRASFTVSGWRMPHDSWETGFGASYDLAKGITLAAEYSTIEKAGAGVFLNYKRLNGAVYYLDGPDDLYFQAGTSFDLW